MGGYYLYHRPLVGKGIFHGFNRIRIYAVGTHKSNFAGFYTALFRMLHAKSRIIIYRLPHMHRFVILWIGISGNSTLYKFEGTIGNWKTEGLGHLLSQTFIYLRQ